MTERLNRSVDDNIGVLRQKRHFNHVEWEKIKSEVDMHELRNSLKRFKNLKVEGDQSQTVAKLDMGHKTGQLQRLNEVIKKLEVNSQRRDSVEIN